VDLLKSHKVLVCAGTGGVGKTTVSAALGLVAAQAGLKVLVLTIDPARRLATALGIGKSDEFVQVPLPNGRGSLWASMIYPEKIFEDFVRATAPHPSAAERLLRNPLYQQLATTLSGSQEFTSLERVLSALESGRFDLIVLDTPPSQHAIDFLRAPQKIFNLFQESVTRWFISSKESSNLIGKLFNQGTRTALMALQRVTGAKFIGELSDFFESIAALQDKVRERSIALHRMLASPQTGFILVTGADEVKLREALEFYEELTREGHHFSGIVLNRTFPDWTLSENPGMAPSKWQEVEGFFRRMKAFSSEQEKSYDKLEAALVIKVPELKGRLSGLEALSRVAEHLAEPLKKDLQ
jgi:anion-transporting  ArsA/GET3 family ATPase